jgi:hypothetical protein
MKTVTQGTLVRPGLKEEVLSHPLPNLVSRLQKEEGISETEAQQMVQDMLMFLFLCGTSPEPCAPSQMIDVAWHNFILFTREYREFCQHYFDRFIDHTPNEPDAAPEIGRLIGRRTIERAREEFGDLSRNWVASLEATECSGNACSFSCGTNCSGSTNCQDG